MPRDAQRNSTGHRFPTKPECHGDVIGIGPIDAETIGNCPGDPQYSIGSAQTERSLLCSMQEIHGIGGGRVLGA